MSLSIRLRRLVRIGAAALGVLLLLGRAPGEAAPASGAVMKNAWRGGQEYVREGRYREAVSYLKNYLGLRPRSADGWFWLGRALECSGEYDRAQFAYRRALEVDPDYPPLNREPAAVSAQVPVQVPVPVPVPVMVPSPVRVPAIVPAIPVAPAMIPVPAPRSALPPMSLPAASSVPSPGMGAAPPGFPPSPSALLPPGPSPMREPLPASPRPVGPPSVPPPYPAPVSTIPPEWAKPSASAPAVSGGTDPGAVLSRGASRRPAAEGAPPAPVKSPVYTPPLPEPSEAPPTGEKGGPSVSPVGGS